MVKHECPFGHKMEKKRESNRLLAMKCPENCIAQRKGCKLNHDISVCYWCLTCGKHYREEWSVS